MKSEKILYFPTAEEAQATAKKLKVFNFKVRAKKKPDGTEIFRVLVYDDEGFFAGFLTAEFAKYLSGETTVAKPNKRPDKYLDLSELAPLERLKEVAEQWTKKGYAAWSYTVFDISVAFSLKHYTTYSGRTYLEITDRSDGVTYENGAESKKVVLVAPGIRKSYPLERLPLYLSFRTSTAASQELGDLYREFMAMVKPVEHHELHTDTSDYDEDLQLRRDTDLSLLGE